MKTLHLTPEQAELTINLLRDRHMELVDRAAMAADCGDTVYHDQLADEYWNLGQLIKQLDFNHVTV